ncbi:MAG: S8 family serine peptidase [Clostridiaceae bacterium]|nr:S8 family serine peptidase [Clostridiaceae bacterium]
MKNRRWFRFIILTLCVVLAGFLPVETTPVFAAGATDTAAGTDPLLDRQAYLDTAGFSPALMQDDQGAGVLVGIIDSGLIPQHEDLAAAHIWAGKNYTGIGSPLSTTDRTGHGTFIAGMLAAQSDNGIGIAGLADAVDLLPLKCFDPNANTTIDMIISAIKDATAAGCDVINMSFGFTTYSAELDQTVKAAQAAGIIMVAAVGNSPSGEPLYPASFDAVIGVGALDAGQHVAPFSQTDRSVFVTAPGENLISLWYTAPGDYKAQGYGTSYAAAFVTALAAMAKSRYPDIRPEAFNVLLAESAVDLGDPGYDTAYGYGRIDAAAFMASLERTAGGTTGIDETSLTEPPLESRPPTPAITPAITGTLKETATIAASDELESGETRNNAQQNTPSGQTDVLTHTNGEPSAWPFPGLWLVLAALLLAGLGILSLIIAGRRLDPIALLKNKFGRNRHSR